MLETKLFQSLIQNLVTKQGFNQSTNQQPLSYKVHKVADHNASVNWVHIYSGETKIKEIIVKCPTDDTKNLEELMKWKNFPKEIQVYEEVLPNFVSYQKQNGHAIWKPWPEYYMGHSDEKLNYILMEDLGTSGYKLSMCPGGHDLQEALFVIRHIAKFHALSFGLFQGQGYEILKKYPHLQEYKYLPQNSSIFESDLKNALLSNAKLIRESSLEFEAEAVAIESICTPDFYSMLCKWVEPSETDSVILQGDLWKENIFFQFNSKNEPVGLKFIDFGFSRVGRKSLDIAYFLYTSVSTEVLMSHRDLLLDTYCSEFQKVLVTFNSSKILSHNEFMEEYNGHKLFGIIVGIFFAGLHKESEPTKITDHANSSSNLAEPVDGKIKRLLFLAREISKSS